MSTISGKQRLSFSLSDMENISLSNVNIAFFVNFFSLIILLFFEWVEKVFLEVKLKSPQESVARFRFVLDRQQSVI